MKVYEAVEAYLHSFQALALGRGECKLGTKKVVVTLKDENEVNIKYFCGFITDVGVQWNDSWEFVLEMTAQNTKLENSWK